MPVPQRRQTPCIPTLCIASYFALITANSAMLQGQAEVLVKNIHDVYLKVVVPQWARMAGPLRVSS